MTRFDPRLAVQLKNFVIPRLRASVESTTHGMEDEDDGDAVRATHQRDTNQSALDKEHYVVVQNAVTWLQTQDDTQELDDYSISTHVSIGTSALGTTARTTRPSRR